MIQTNTVTQHKFWHCKVLAKSTGRIVWVIIYLTITIHPIAHNKQPLYQIAVTLRTGKAFGLVKSPLTFSLYVISACTPIRRTKCDLQREISKTGSSEAVSAIRGHLPPLGQSDTTPDLLFRSSDTTPDLWLWSKCHTTRFASLGQSNTTADLLSC